MSAALRLAAVAVAISALIPVAAHAMDDFIVPSSSTPMVLKLCGNGSDDPITPAACKEAGYDKQVARIDKAFNAALSKTPSVIKPLLKRDQAWFNETVLNAAQSVPQSDDFDEKEGFGETLEQRAAALQGIAAGFGRPGLTGRWVNAFGSVVVTPADGGAYRLAADLRAVYGSGGDHLRACKLSALVKPSAGAWLIGEMLPDEPRPAKAADDKSEPKKPPAIKIRRQGETLRVVVSGQEWSEEDRPNCQYMWQVTASYFASGKDAAATEKADTAFVTPTFDCTRPETATDEEICADPDLADNDQRLNRAWKALQPRLDETTRRALMDDQHNWIRAQARQYPVFLHPGWEKLTSDMHFTTSARDHVDGLQRERIALLEGFDDKRSGLAGVWLGYNAILKVTVDADGSLEAKGWKWDQGNWKAGCDYDMSGKLVGGQFRANDQDKNPDTLERDHATLIVNRQDDAFAKKRSGEHAVDEMKCKRSPSNSSTARLFPARPSPDINDFGSSIR
jgi:uncharacterized protein YecT (DUF1311 family)